MKTLELIAKIKEKLGEIDELACGGKNAKDIGKSLFSEYAYSTFYKAFAEAVGTTPLQYLEDVRSRHQLKQAEDGGLLEAKPPRNRKYGMKYGAPFVPIINKTRG